ncbi:hypothetical protein Q9R32_02725 [Actinotalea sp. AC32]|nr:hypothetical protein [Actinotalea sp. AC32]
MVTAGAGADPSWFDWLNLAVTTGVTAVAAAVPAWIAIALWRADRRLSRKERRAAAIREFTHLLAAGDRVLLQFRDLGYFANVMGPGASGLLRLIWRYMDWDSDEERELGPAPTAPITPVAPDLRIDLSVDVTHAIGRWNADPAYRADLTEVYLANGEVFPAAEDNRIISPSTRRAAEDAILRDADEYREWLAGTRLAPGRIRRRRLLGRLGIRPQADEPLNPLALDTYIEDEDVLAGDAWLRERTTAELD